MLEATNCRNGLATNASTMHSAFRLSESLGNDRNMKKRALMRMMPAEGIACDFESLVDDAVRMSRSAAVGHIQTLNTWDVQDELGNLNLPVLVMGGQNDRLIPTKALCKAAQKLPQGRLIIWPNVGHTPQLERPERFVKILLKFIEQSSVCALTEIRKNIFRIASCQIPTSL